MAEHRNVDRVRRAYAAFAAGDLPSVLEEFAPDGVMHAGGDGPFSGDHKGREAIGAMLIGAFQFTGATQALELGGIYADDLHGIVNVRETATRESDGATLDMPEVHLMAFGPDGKITDFWDIPEDHDVHDDFFSGR
ncbi:MAG: nuclear transport factor 2 family protein [Acidimicrobiia bacterium]